MGGVQSSLQSSMDLMAYVMGIVISNPQVKFSKAIDMVSIRGDYGLEFVKKRIELSYIIIQEMWAWARSQFYSGQAWPRKRIWTRIKNEPEFLFFFFTC